MTVEAAALPTLRRRRPWLAALLSFVCVGLGQLYNGEWRRALGFCLAFVLADGFIALTFGVATPSLLTVVWLLALALAGIGLRIVAAVDAFRRARRIGAAGLRRFQRGWVYATALVVIALLEFAITRSPTAWRSYSIPSASMMPTLEPGDYVFAERGYFHRHAARRGDLAVFRSPGNRSVDYVKRIIGVPGDRVALSGGDVYLNGKRLDRRRIADFAPAEEKSPIPQFVEILPDGRRYPILHASGLDALDTLAETTVPPGRYFVLGDYRSQSMDSRVPEIGFVPADDLTDRPYLIFWSRSLGRIGMGVD